MNKTRTISYADFWTDALHKQCDAIQNSLKGWRLKRMAEYINSNLKHLTAHIERGYCNTDRQIAGTRLRHPGKGRWGNRIIVKRKRDGKVVLDHNSAETYRHNHEVARWIAYETIGFYAFKEKHHLC